MKLAIYSLVALFTLGSTCTTFSMSQEEQEKEDRELLQGSAWRAASVWIASFYLLKMGAGRLTESGALTKYDQGDQTMLHTSTLNCAVVASTIAFVDALPVRMLLTLVRAYTAYIADKLETKTE